MKPDDNGENSDSVPERDTFTTRKYVPYRDSSFGTCLRRVKPDGHGKNVFPSLKGTNCDAAKTSLTGTERSSIRLVGILPTLLNTCLSGTTNTMAQTLFSSYYHIVFSTKNRASFIDVDIEDELYAYIGGIIRNFDSKLMSANGTPNHGHLLVSTSKNHLVPTLVGAVKRDSSKWIKTKGIKYSKFGWQDGYSAFTVGYSQIPVVEKYIANQKDHHKKRLFEDEMRGFYRKYKIDFDEKYVWD